MKVFHSSHALALSLFSLLAQAAPPPPTLIQRSRPDAVNLAKRATCTPTAGGDSSTDDVPAITSALSTCGNGGTIEIPAGKTYYLNTILDLTGCVGCTFNIEGTLMASDDLDYWEGKTAIIYIKDIQTATIQSRTGSGIIDGNGQAAWEEFASNSDYARPTLHYITGKSSGITVKNLQVKNPPNVFFSVNGASTNILYDSLTMSAVSDSNTAPKNTDGFDIGSSTYVTLTNINVANQDDCVAFKPGCNYVTVDGITCSGSHGLSVGSLGSKNIDTVQNVYVTNATMIDSAKAVGIKLYPGGEHGQGIVKNVTYDGVTVTNCDYAAQIQSCYGEDADYCSEYPSNGTITDVVFKNFKGTTSDKYEPVTANLDCPADGTCGITFDNWDIGTPDGTAEVLCANTGSDIGVTCTDGASG